MEVLQRAAKQQQPKRATGAGQLTLLIKLTPTIPLNIIPAPPPQLSLPTTNSSAFYLQPSTPQLLTPPLYRLCDDFIAEHLGHSNFLEVREIDFPNLSIRVIDLGDGENFKNLRRQIAVNCTKPFQSFLLFQKLKTYPVTQTGLYSISAPFG